MNTKGKIGYLYFLEKKFEKTFKQLYHLTTLSDSMAQALKI